MATVTVPEPLFFTMYIFPDVPTAVGKVAVNVPDVQSMK